MRRLTFSLVALAWAAVGLPRSAAAASFDSRGELRFEDSAVLSQSFESEDDNGIRCADGCTYALHDQASSGELALQGERFVRANGQRPPFEVDLALPPVDDSYQFRLWLRHARVRARVIIEYTSAERETEVAYLFPSGRVTSDGWVELESNPVSVTGSALARAYIRMEAGNLDIDAVEVVRQGNYQPGNACLGAFDSACGPEAVCISERCREGARYVPPLPPEEHRTSTTDYLVARIQHLFGGQLSRTVAMPAALLRMQDMHVAQTPWQYWRAFAHGIRLLGDWHTSIGSAIGIHTSDRRLGVCFIEGHADLSETVAPSTRGRSDVLVSHVGSGQNSLGLRRGDRLVAIDGLHPIEWARSLHGVNWGYHAATDPDVDAEFAESLAGLLPTYARSFSVIRCDAASASCASSVETIDVTSIPVGGTRPACDNRPLYHLDNPPDGIESTHYVPFEPWRDRVTGSPAGEDIYGMTWDSLYGTSAGLTPIFLENNEFFRRNARGVILDHRAGNGGTIDAPQAISQLVRTPFDLSVGPGFMAIAGDNGPATDAEGVELFEYFRGYEAQLYRVGSSTPDLALPVALIIHRDGSASDWLPHGMKGAPKVRIFGSNETAGAFSSFYEFSYWSRFDFQIASGDTITYEGKPLIGHGIAPDVIVRHTQSALLQGRDLPFEAAIAWVRENLK